MGQLESSFYQRIPEPVIILLYRTLWYLWKNRSLVLYNDLTILKKVEKLFPSWVKHWAHAKDF